MIKTKEQRASSPRILYLIGISVLVIVMFGFIVAYFGKKSYEQAVLDSKETSVRLAHILSEHVELSFLEADFSLRLAIERQNFNAIAVNGSQKYNTEQDFKSWLNAIPQVSALALINENGEVEAAVNKKDYGNWLDSENKLIGRKLVEQMRVAGNTDVFIGQHSMKSGNSTIIMSRRYNKQNGKFGGVVIAAVDPQYFVDFYDSIAQGNRKFMSIMLFNNTVLASSPYNSALNELLGKEFLNTQDKTQNAVYQQRVTTQDSDKIVALNILPNMSIAVQVVIDEEDFLVDWRQSRMKDVGFLVLFVVFGSILSFFSVAMARQVGRVQNSENTAILASQAKSEFLANMSHELRTPLNAIIGFSEMINSGYFGDINERQKERIYDINLCGSHLLQLINDILEFSKGDAGKLELVDEKVNLEEMVDESVRIMRGRIKSKNIELVVNVEPNLPLLWGDKRKIRQVLINLLSNSFKFTPEYGRITVCVAVDSYNDLYFSVADTGVGMSEEDIPKALSVFGQVHRSQNQEGTGLGLPLCKMYAELHDGKLILTSKLNVGTTVKILFPHQRSLPNNNYYAQPTV